jgi:hypothetical protein
MGNDISSESSHQFDHVQFNKKMKQSNARRFLLGGRCMIWSSFCTDVCVMFEVGHVTGC